MIMLIVKQKYQKKDTKSNPVYVITVMHIYLLKEKQQLITAGDDVNNTNKKVICKNCAPFTDCIIKINNTQVDNASRQKAESR